MTQAAPRLRPPHIAAWLVELFASAEQAESILGDLDEEFSDVASKSEVVTARQWYWRQSAKSIFHLCGAAFRNAPWSIAVIVLLGFLIHWVSATLPEDMIWAILHAQRPFSNRHYKFYVWLINDAIPIACVLTSLIIGCVVAVLAKGRELVAALTLIAVCSIPFIWLLAFVYEHRGQGFPSTIHFIVFRHSLDVVGTLVAGVLVKKLRSFSSRPLAIP